MISGKKYSYRIDSEDSEEKFYLACQALEKTIPNMKKETLFYNMFNGSMLQKYLLENREIAICNDAEIGAVYAESDLSLPKDIGWEMI